jgi:Gram-negative bacterial TonB protein C-terminal
MQSVYRPVRRECFAGMPHSIEKGEKGIVSIEFRVQQDGKVPADSLKILSSSGKEELDDASLNAIHNDLFHLPSSAPKARLSYAAANVLASTCLTANAVARTWERDLTTFVSTNVRNVVNATLLNLGDNVPFCPR